jgi:AraC-like DNA-binding protein
MTAGMAEASSAFSFTTKDLPIRAAFDAYHALYAAGADPLMEDADFHATMTSHRFFRMIIHDRQLHAVRHLREAPRVRHDGFSHFTATVCLGGTVHSSGNDGFRQLRSGEVLLLDMSRPMATRLENAHILTVAIGREIVESAIGEARRAHGRILDRATAAPLVRYLTDLTTGRHVDVTTRDPVQDVADLLGHMLDPLASDAAQGLRGRRLFAARRMIEADLDNPRLDAAWLAGRLGLSRATLYRLFEPFGGVGQYLLHRRILRLRRLLAERDQRASFEVLASQAGFLSESHASRVFLNRFHYRPGLFRRNARHLSDTEHAALCMAIWQDDLR